MTRRSGGRDADALACVLGDVDLVRALGLGGIACVPVVAHCDPARYSRHAVGAIEPLDHWTQRGELVERLVAWAGEQPRRPVLYFQTDGDLLMTSRHRERLAQALDFAIAGAGLVEALVDKARFARLAAELGLPVPPSAVLRTGEPPDAAGALRFPLVLKPLLRRDLRQLHTDAKAVAVDSERALRELWAHWETPGVEVLAQQLVPGPEARIESHHAYVDAGGRLVAEFTGVKLRTRPSEYGHTCALAITDAPDVARAGREVLETIGLSGIAKVDFKRTADGSLALLEVNPRFNLWHHAGAAAGINLPAVVHADLTGAPRPPVARAARPVRWCAPLEDRHASRDVGMPARRWLGFALRSETRSGGDWGDPWPLARGVALPLVLRKLRRRVTRQ
jgi:D-aspartate ligase